MSRIRTIKPEFFSSQQVADCSPTSRLLFIGLWCFADDHGVIPDKPRQIKMSVFPGDDTVTTADVIGYIQELVNAGLLLRYTVNGETYLIVTGWKHQRVDKPRFRYPLPNDPRAVADNSENGSGIVDERSDTPIRSTRPESTRPDQKNPVSPLSGDADEIYVLRGQGQNGHAQHADRPRRERKKPGTLCPEDFQPSDSDYEFGKRKFGMNRIDVMRPVDEFITFNRGKGYLHADWHQTFRNRLCQIAARRSTAPGEGMTIAQQVAERERTEREAREKN